MTGDPPARRPEKRLHDNGRRQLPQRLGEWTHKELVKVVDSGKDTLNVYSAIVCNPSKNTRGHYEASMALVKYLASDEGQKLFKEYGVSQFSQALFKPWITTLKANTETELIQWVKDYAYIEGSDCPTTYRLNPGDLYS